MPKEIRLVLRKEEDPKEEWTEARLTVPYYELSREYDGEAHFSTIFRTERELWLHLAKICKMRADGPSQFD